MSLPVQPANRLLPFDRDEPGSWQRWENFWVDFLNAGPLLPWPGSNPIQFKHVILAEKYGTPGGKQDGIDIRAEMDDGTILAVQCKDYQTFDLKTAKAAMDKAEQEFTDAKAYLLVITNPSISTTIDKEAKYRRNWRVLGRDSLSSWFLAGKFLPKEKQVRLVKGHFGPGWAKHLFPLPSDELLITPEQFFARKTPVHHDARLHGKATIALASELAGAMDTNSRRITILIAPGGQGKTRFLKSVAEQIKEKSPNRKIRFQNDSADFEAEDHSLRAENFNHLSLFIDDGHRLENFRMRLLKEIHQSEGATVIIATRPNSLEPLKTKLLQCGFPDQDCAEFNVPQLDFSERKSIALELLGGKNGDELAAWLAEQSKDCLLVCTVGADLFKSGKIERELINTPDFKRKVFNHLMETTLDGIREKELKPIAEPTLRILSMAGPIEKSDDLLEKIAAMLARPSWEIDQLISQFESAGILRISRSKLQVIPELLADHLVYDTAYGNGKSGHLIKKTIDTFSSATFANLFGNLAEAEWRANQEGTTESYLQGMWENVRTLLENPDDLKIFALLDAWRKFAVFQPERTLELAGMILKQETKRKKAGIPEVIHDGYRYDPIAMHLGKLPDLLAPIAFHHRKYREAVLDALWEIGCIKEGVVPPVESLPAAWEKIAETGSLKYQRTHSSEDVLAWLKKWAARKGSLQSLQHGKFLNHVISQWFKSDFDRNWMEGNAMIIQPGRVLDAPMKSFRRDVLKWLRTAIIPLSIKACWSILGTLQIAGGQNSRYRREIPISQDDENARVEITREVLFIFKGILIRYRHAAIRLSVWQHLSSRASAETQPALLKEIKTLRNSIPRDTAFQLTRLASGSENFEWTREHLKPRERDDYRAASDWWSELALHTVTNLRATLSIGESLTLIDHLNKKLLDLNQRNFWDMVAQVWSKHFPGDKELLLEELMRNPARAIVPTLGYFIAGRREEQGDFFRLHMLRALDHDDDRIRRAALSRLAWSDIVRNDAIVKKLQMMSSSTDREIVSSIVGFISWHHGDPAPYLDDALASLNGDIVSSEDLIRLGAAITGIVEYSGHLIAPTSMAPYFLRLQQEEDIQKAYSGNTAAILHQKFPAQMLKVYLNRVRSGQPLPWSLDEWSLAELAKDQQFETFATDVLDVALQTNKEGFWMARDLFDAAVARVNPVHAASLLLAEIGAQPLKKIISLTGFGHGSVVYDAPDFTRKLLLEIENQPTSKAKKLRDKLIQAAVPSSWGTTNGEIDDEYLWAKDKGAKLAEEFRADPLLHPFYRDIVRNQEALAEEVRIRHRELNL